MSLLLLQSICLLGLLYVVVLPMKTILIIKQILQIEFNSNLLNHD